MDTLDHDWVELSEIIGTQEDGLVDVDDTLHESARHHSSDTRNRKGTIDVEFNGLDFECFPIFAHREQIQEVLQKLEGLAGNIGHKEDGSNPFRIKISRSYHNIVFS